eukprot:scaffold13798_cov36-Tisochrysis_lutea.AAC.3
MTPRGESLHIRRLIGAFGAPGAPGLLAEPQQVNDDVAALDSSLDIFEAADCALDEIDSPEVGHWLQMTHIQLVPAVGKYHLTADCAEA